MSKRKDVFRLYDRVNIINPEIFVRCGYPLTKQMMKEEMSKEQRDAIHEMFRKFGVHTNFEDGNSLKIDYRPLDDKAFERVLDIMSGVLLRKKLWGGKERRIYTERRDMFLNATGTVFGKRAVKTGDYSPGSSYKSWTDYGYEYDYDPPYLANEETHVILELHTDFLGNYPGGHTIEIEKCHVEHIAKKVEQLV